MNSNKYKTNNSIYKILYSQTIKIVRYQQVVEADFMEVVSQQLETAIMQYDTFIRDLHMKMLDYWESTWVNATTRLFFIV